MSVTLWTVGQYQTLCAAIVEGVKQVQYSDKMVTYRSLDEMIRIKAEMERDLNIGENAAVEKAYQGRNVGGYTSGI